MKQEEVLERFEEALLLAKEVESLQCHVPQIEKRIAEFKEGQTPTELDIVWVDYFMVSGLKKKQSTRIAQANQNIKDLIDHIMARKRDDLQGTCPPVNEKMNCLNTCWDCKHAYLAKLEKAFLDKYLVKEEI